MVSDSLQPLTVHRLLQARILEWVAFPFSRRSSQSRDQPGLLHSRQILYQLSHQGSPCDISSVQFCCLVTSDSLQPHGLQHIRPPCPPQTPGVYSNSCPSSWWRHPIISFSVIPFFSCPQSFPALGCFPVSQLFASGGQSIVVSASVSDLPMNILISFRTDWLDLLAVQGTLKSILKYQSSKASNLWHWAFFIIQLSHPYMTTGKTIALTRQTFIGKVMFLLFNMPSMLVIAFLPRSKHLLISWLWYHLQWFWSPKK